MGYLIPTPYLGGLCISIGREDAPCLPAEAWSLGSICHQIWPPRYCQPRQDRLLTRRLLQEGFLPLDWLCCCRWSRGPSKDG
jgi:hypothetical protein